MELKNTLNYLFAGNSLTKDEARQVLLEIGHGSYTDPEIASFVTIYLMRPITPAELGGFREAMLELCVPVDLSDYNTIDVCGTGGDEKNTFNISTLTAFVLAGAGIKVVKHGNYGVSSPCGSSNVVEHLGYQFTNAVDRIKREIEQANITYLHAPLFHPAMKYVAPVRKSLKVKTFFNLLGPMVNPSRPKNQMAGVYNVDIQDLYAGVYNDTELNYCIVYNLDGYDEISLTGDFRVLTRQGEKIYSPAQLGFDTVYPKDIVGGECISDSGNIFQKVLEGKGTAPQSNVVIANAAFAIQTIHPDKAIEDCIAMAKESMQSGKAAQVLKKLIELK